MKFLNKLVIALVFLSTISGACLPKDSVTYRPLISNLEEQLVTLTQGGNPQTLTKDELVQIAQDKQKLEETIILLRELETQKDIGQFWRDVEKKAKRGTLIAGVLAGSAALVGGYLAWKGYRTWTGMVAERDTAVAAINETRVAGDAALAAQATQLQGLITQVTTERDAARQNNLGKIQALDDTNKLTKDLEAKLQGWEGMFPQLQLLMTTQGQKATLEVTRIAHQVEDVEKAVAKHLKEQEKINEKRLKELEKLQKKDAESLQEKFEKVTGQMADMLKNIGVLETAKKEAEETGKDFNDPKKLAKLHEKRDKKNAQKDLLAEAIETKPTETDDDETPVPAAEE